MFCLDNIKNIATFIETLAGKVSIIVLGEVGGSLIIEV